MSYKRVITKKNILGGVILGVLTIGLIYGFIEYLPEEAKNFLYGLFGIIGFLVLTMLGFSLVNESEYKYIEDPPKKTYKYIANTAINRKLHPKGEVVLRVEE